MSLPVVQLSVLAAFAVAAATAGCSDGEESTASGTTGVATVIATTSILGDIVQNVAGDCVTVEVVMPPGTDPHDFELSARDAAGLREADLVFSFGLGLEESLHDALEAASEDGVTVVEVAESIEALPFADDEHSDEAGDDEHSDLDPHVWQDPARMAEVVATIGTTLTESGACDGTPVSDQAEEYAATLRALDTEVAERYATIPEDHRLLVTNHEAFGYLADRYGLEILGTVIPSGSTLAEPSAADLADLVALIEETGVPAIFGETTDSAALLEALADEIGRPIEIIELHSDSLSDSESGAGTYVGLVRTNAELITDALAG